MVAEVIGTLPMRFASHAATGETAIKHEGVWTRSGASREQSESFALRSATTKLYRNRASIVDRRGQKRREDRLCGATPTGAAGRFAMAADHLSKAFFAESHSRNALRLGHLTGRPGFGAWPCLARDGVHTKTVGQYWP